MARFSTKELDFAHIYENLGLASRDAATSLNSTGALVVCCIEHVKNHVVNSERTNVKPLGGRTSYKATYCYCSAVNNYGSAVDHSPFYDNGAAEDFSVDRRSAAEDCLASNHYDGSSADAYSVKRCSANSHSDENPSIGGASAVNQ